MTVETLLTLDEFLDLPDEAGYFQELLYGKLIKLAAPRFEHGAMQARIAQMLLNLTDGRFPDLLIATHTGFVLSPETVQAPDVAVIRRNTYHALETKHGSLVGAPDLAIEIVSPSESAQDLDEKVDAYLSGGTKTVWVIWPKTRHVLVYDSDGGVTKAGMGASIKARNVFAETDIAVASLFPVI